MDVDCLKRVILTGIQKGSYDYESIRLITNENYNEVLKVISRPLTTIDAVLDLLELIGIDGIKKYGLSRSSTLVYNTPRNVLPLISQGVHRGDIPLMIYPIMIHAKRGETYNIISDNKCVKITTPGFYMIHPGINNTYINSSTASTVCVGMEKKAYVENLKLRVYNDSTPAPPCVTSGYVMVSSSVPADKIDEWVPLRDNVYYIPMKDDGAGSDIETPSISFPFQVVRDGVYNTKLLIKLQKIFMVEWMMFTLSGMLRKQSKKLTPEYLMTFSIYDLDYLKSAIMGNCGDDDMAKMSLLFSDIVDYTSLCPTCDTESYNLAT